MNILEKIALKTRERVEEAKQNKPLKVLQEEVFELIDKENAIKKEVFRFENSIKSFNVQNKIAFICEVKKASPSKGLIDKEIGRAHV